MILLEDEIHYHLCQQSTLYIIAIEKWVSEKRRETRKWINKMHVKTPIILTISTVLMQLSLFKWCSIPSVNKHKENFYVNRAVASWPDNQLLNYDSVTSSLLKFTIKKTISKLRIRPKQFLLLYGKLPYVVRRIEK